MARCNGWSAPNDYHPCSDAMNGVRFADAKGDKALYCPQWKKWLAWDGCRWASDDGAIIVRDAAKRVVRAIAHEAARDGLTDEVKDAIKAWARTSQNRRGVDAMLDAAESELPADASLFDTQPDLLNGPEGTADMTHGLHEHQHDDMLTQIAAVSPTEDQPKLFLEILGRAFAKDQEMISYLKRLLGYTLTGHVHEQEFYIHYGPGQNGKSVILGTVRRILKDYATTAAIATFCVNPHGTSPFDLAALRGKRMVLASETEEGQRWNESLLKQLTGGDEVPGRLLYEQPTTFAPVCKLHFMVNHLPHVRDFSKAMQRRVRVIPWDVVIPDDEVDKKLADKLRPEWGAILGWMIEGCHEWQKQGLATPQKVIEATAEYLESENTPKAWLAERCIRDSAKVTLFDHLYGDYDKWAKAGNEFRLSKKRFGQWLQFNGFARDRDPAGNRTYLGVALREGEPKSEGPPPGKLY
jgi:putative DNA primase/helicase